MKKLLFISFMIAMGAYLFAIKPVNLTVGGGYVDPIPTVPGSNRMPPACPNLSIDGHTLYFNNVGYDLTLVLLDEDGEEAYTTFVPAGTTAVVLPSTLSGEYELQLLPGGSFYFYTVVTL